MKKLFLCLLLLLIYNNIYPQAKVVFQPISIKLTNVKSIVNITLDYLITTVPYDDIYVSKDTIIKLKNDKDYPRSVYGNYVPYGNGNMTIGKITIKNNIKGYINSFDKNYFSSHNYSIIIDFDSVETAERNKELAKQELIQKQDSIKEAINDNLLYRIRQMLPDIVKDIADYDSRIKGQRNNKIADYLYDEGFGRRYKTSGSNFYTIYGVRFTYDDGDYYDIDIYTWYSYGYGSLYYDIRTSIYLKGYGCVVNEDKETYLYEKLLK